jgi:hypothetical protein
MVWSQVKHRTLKGLDPRINPDKPPRNFKAAMAALDNQAWAAAYTVTMWNTLVLRNEGYSKW